MLYNVVSCVSTITDSKHWNIQREVTGHAVYSNYSMSPALLDHIEMDVLPHSHMSTYLGRVQSAWTP